MQARKVELKIVARDEAGNITRATPLEQLSAVWRAGWEAFKAMPEDEQAKFFVVVGDMLQKNPAIAKALGVAVGARTAEPFPPWAPCELNTLVTSDDGCNRKITRRGMTMADIGVSAQKSADGACWDYLFGMP